MGLSKRKEGPLDPFKRALTAATRSIACDSAVEVIGCAGRAWPQLSATFTADSGNSTPKQR